MQRFHSIPTRTYCMSCQKNFLLLLSLIIITVHVLHCSLCYRVTHPLLRISASGLLPTLISMHARWAIFHCYFHAFNELAVYSIILPFTEPAFLSSVFGNLALPCKLCGAFFILTTCVDFILSVRCHVTIHFP